MRADFAAVDDGSAADLVAMMDATDAWPAVRAARVWVLDTVGIHAGALVVDAGCGPGTFGATARATECVTVDLDCSLVMLHETRRRHGSNRAVVGDVAGLPLRTDVAAVVRAERVLQWTIDPYAGLAELVRVTARDGWIAVTDTDWGTFVVEHPDASASRRMAAAALGWVPHPRFARDLRRALEALGATDLLVRTDAAQVTAWTPDDPAEHDGPPGLPLRSIAAAAAPRDQATLDRDLAVLADQARRGQFHASLELVTVVARV